MLQAKLFVLNHEIPLLKTEMGYHRGFDARMGVTSDVVGGKISLTFETLEDADELMHWITKTNGADSMDERSKMEEGKVCFYDHGFDNSPTAIYEFNDAYLVKYREYFNSRSAQQMLTTIVISPAIQRYHGVEKIKSWNISHLNPVEELPYQPMEEVVVHPKIYDLYFEDMDGNRIKELEIGQEVYLVVASENASGKAVNINLGDKDHDFVYQGELLEDDILTDISISGDLHKEKLLVVADHRADDEGDEPSPTSPQNETSPTAGGPAPEKKLTEYFLTDANGEKVEEYEVGDTITLNIKTENRIGDKLTIHLEDKTHDFKYNGEVLKDDKLTDYTITKDEEKIELEVIVQTSKS